MANIKEIKEPINDHLLAFEKKFEKAMKTRVALLDYITRYIIRRKGKQMRPMFVFFWQELPGKLPVNLSCCLND